MKPWLPINSDFKQKNVEVLERSEDSLLYCYRRFLKIRSENEALHSGDIKIIDSNYFPQDKVLVYSRSTSNQTLFIVLNFTNKNLIVPNTFGESAQKVASTTSNYKVVTSTAIPLGPFEGVIIKL